MDVLRGHAELRIVGGCNRMQPADFVARFERAGFEALAFQEHSRIQVDDGMRSRFAEPWRSMDQRVFEVTQGAIRTRKMFLA